MQRLTELVSKIRSTNFDEFFFNFRYPILLGLIGLILLGLGAFLVKKGAGLSATKVEVLNSSTEGQTGNKIVVEVAGSVEKPGVYKFDNNSRIEDALIAAGGVSADADRVWVERTLNRAAKLTDGQKIFIPQKSESKQTLGVSANYSGGDQTVSPTFVGQGSGLININTASLSELDSLSGIGPVYGQNIIDHRPYSSVEELLSKGVLKKSVYEKVRDKVSIF